jgi:hypothetical protein
VKRGAVGIGPGLWGLRLWGPRLWGPRLWGLGLLVTLAGCGERVSLGGGGSGGEPPNPGGAGGAGGGGTGGAGAGEPCEGLPCGTACEPPPPCVDTNCVEPQVPPDVPWTCDAFGACVPGPPQCSPQCLDAPCGVPCDDCGLDPSAPCVGPRFCDGFGGCVELVECFVAPCEGPDVMCGDPCDPCAGWNPAEACPVIDEPGVFYVCDGYAQCVASPTPECPPYDSCDTFPAGDCEPCSNCAPNDPTCVPEPPKVCDIDGICSEDAAASCP